MYHHGHGAQLNGKEKAEKGVGEDLSGSKGLQKSCEWTDCTYTRVNSGNLQLSPGAQAQIEFIERIR
jgi:hypothetical protein